MQLIVQSDFVEASVTTAPDLQGRDHLVVVIKCTWRIPHAGQRPKPVIPEPLVNADIYCGEPGLSALRYGNDLTPFKPKCDIVFDSSAHAPDGKEVQELVAGFRVGSVTKHVKVIGNRYWRKRLGFLTLSNAESFQSMPLHYERAYGGSLAYEGKKGARMADTYLPNPVGCGWAGKNTLAQLINSAAPNLEAIEDPVKSANASHKPIAFGPIPPHWQLRSRFQGTLDEEWQKKRFPFLPEDFDERYYQVAPPDQQMEYPKGGEEVVLINLLKGTPHLAFSLPSLHKMPIRILMKNRRTQFVTPVVDTLYFETELMRFSAIWRARIPLQRHIQEIDTVAVGNIDPNWWREKTYGESSCVGCKTTKAAA